MEYCLRRSGACACVRASVKVLRIIKPSRGTGLRRPRSPFGRTVRVPTAPQFCHRGDPAPQRPTQPS